MKQKLSLQDFAFVLDTSAANVSLMIKGGKTPDFERGKRSAVLFNVEDVEQWVNSEEEREVKEAHDKANARRLRLANM